MQFIFFLKHIYSCIYRLHRCSGNILLQKYIIAVFTAHVLHKKQIIRKKLAVHEKKTISGHVCMGVHG